MVVIGLKVQLGGEDGARSQEQKEAVDGRSGSLGQRDSDQTALQDLSWGLGLALGLFRFTGDRQAGSSVCVPGTRPPEPASC